MHFSFEIFEPELLFVLQSVKLGENERPKLVFFRRGHLKFYEDLSFSLIVFVITFTFSVAKRNEENLRIRSSSYKIYVV